MRVVTYNILAEADPSADLRLQQATAVLQAARPDVLALNECTLLAEPARLAQLQAALGMEAWLAHAGSGFHLALLVRAGVFEHIETLHAGFAHAALIADLRVRGRALRVLCVHLEPYSPERRLVEVLQLQRYLQQERPTLLLGDLNALSPRDAAQAEPERWVERYRQRHMTAAGAIDTRAISALLHAGLIDVHAALHAQTVPTRPTERYARADRPRQRLDYIFASPQLARTARECEPFAHPLADRASDHLPLYADFTDE